MTRTPGGPPCLTNAILFAPPVSSRPAVPVACALILDTSGRVLLAQRPAHKHLGLKWEFPGGKIEATETPTAALIREIREELACDIRTEKALPPFRHDYGSVMIEMYPFVCRLTETSPPPHPHEHVALAWATASEVRAYDLAPADLPLLEYLM